MMKKNIATIIQSRIYDDMDYMNNKIIEVEMDGEEQSK